MLEINRHAHVSSLPYLQIHKYNSEFPEETIK